MKRLSTGFVFGLLTLAGCAQKGNQPKADSEIAKSSNTLLWKISGNGLDKPSYLYGTMHMLCKDDAVLSANFKKAIKGADEVYLEIKMDNMLELMMGAMTMMKMNGDTTLKDLLNEADYAKVKKYFEDKQSMIPFGMLETFKPIVAASTLAQDGIPCESTAAMEEVIMKEAKSHEVGINGLETVGYQAGMLDSIPYKVQAQQLVNYINMADKEDADKEILEMLKAYNEQDLAKLEQMIIKSDPAISSYTDILLYNRNRNWVAKLKTLLPGKSLVVAVGAGHLPGDQGVINLLKKAGYTVEPMENKLVKSKEI